MKLKIIVIVVASLLGSLAWADKPEWAGKGKPTEEQKADHRTAMKSKSSANDKENNQIDSDKSKAIQNQSAKKSHKAQKELDKGSAKGKESRENRKKWWQFWG